MPKRILVLHGMPGVGKLTTATRLRELLAPSFRLFHNHLVVDLCHSLFDFGTPQFNRTRLHIWLHLFRQAIESELDLIFTFAFERTADEFFEQFLALCTELGAQLLFVRLHCASETLRSRMTSDSRKTRAKLTDLTLFDQLIDSGFLYEGRGPTGDWLEIDTTNSTADETAALIVQRLHEHEQQHEQQPQAPSS